MIYQNLIQEILNELLLKGSRGQQTVQICAKKLSDEVARTIISVRFSGISRILHTYPQEVR